MHPFVARFALLFGLGSLSACTLVLETIARDAGADRTVADVSGDRVGSLDVVTDVAAQDAAVDVPVAPDVQITCAPTERVCAGVCTNVQSDDANCGACDIACPTGTRCTNGHCDCANGETRCDGQCVNVANDRANCGSCGTVCPNTMVCAAGQCVTSCASPTTDCGGSCVDVSTSIDHCGTCLDACAGVSNGQASCVNGTCGVVCNAGFHACAERCVSDLDPNTCGHSCTPCPPAPTGGITTCSASGTCGVRCAVGFHQCSGACVSDTSPNSCGTSCTPCVADANTVATCVSGQCGSMCRSGFARCAGVCVSLSTTTNCGGCGIACQVGQTCSAGACVGSMSCGTGQVLCGARCTNLNTDPTNCGACGIACSGGSGCVGGSCITPVMDVITRDATASVDGG